MPLVLFSTGAVIFLLAVAVLLFVKLQDRGRWWVLMVAVPLSIALAAALGTVSGYEITDKTLYIRHPGWSSRIELTALVGANRDPQVIDRSQRVWGNGGLFSFTGSFRNAKWGTMGVYATDPSLAVVLKWPDRAIVVTPDDPDRFIQTVIDRVG
jgi:hypothetical protein